MLFVPGSAAVEYRFDPAIQLRTLFDDNLDMRIPGEEIISFGVDVAPQLRATATSDTWQFAFNGKLNFVQFEDEVFNSEDQDVSFRMTRTTPRTVFQLDLANIRREDVTAGIQDIDELARINERVDRQIFSPAFQYILSPKNRVVISGTIANTHYDALNFNDFDYNGVTIGWTHQFDERTTFDINVEATDFDSVTPFQLALDSLACRSDVPEVTFNSNGFGSESLGINIGATYQWTEQLLVRASVGTRETDSEQDIVGCGDVIDVQIINGQLVFFTQPLQQTPTSSADSLLLDLGMQYRGEKYDLTLNLSRSVEPVGLGFLSQRDSAILNIDYKLAEKITASLISRYNNVDGLDEALSSNFGRENFMIQPSLNWRVTEQWTVNGGVRFRQVENEDALGVRREGFQVFAGARYKFKPTLISR